MDSILGSIKKLLGIADEYEHFDQAIIMHINSVFNVLSQLGVGPYDGFSIEDDSATWLDFMEDDTRLNLVKSYMYLQVKLLFDPPLSSTTIESMNRSIREYEWRLNVTTDQCHVE